jgi:hypothetical protein
MHKTVILLIVSGFLIFYGDCFVNAATSTMQQTLTWGAFQFGIRMLGIILLICLCGLMLKVVIGGTKAVKKGILVAKNNVQKNVMPILENSSANNYWNNLNSVLQNIEDPIMRKTLIYIETTRICKAIVNKTIITNRDEDLFNCNQCADIVSENPVEDSDFMKSEIESRIDYIEIYAEALAVIGIAYFKLDSSEHAASFCRVALQCMPKNIPHYEERAAICRKILKVRDKG